MKGKTLGAGAEAGACGEGSVQVPTGQWSLPGPGSPLPPQPWDLRGAGHGHSGSHRVDFLGMVMQDMEGGTV